MPETTAAAPTDVLSLAAVAERLNVSRRTIQSWVSSGRMAGYQPVPGPRAPYVVAVSEVERVERDMKS